MKLSYFFLFLILANFKSHAQEQKYSDSLDFYLERNDLKKCILYYDLLIKHSNSAQILLFKGEFLFQQKMYSEAIEAFTKALKINPNINDALVRRGKAYLALKKYDSCMNDFANSIGKYPYHDSTIFLFRSYAFESIGEEKKYKQDLDSVLKFTKSLKVLHNALGMVKSEMQDYNGALLEFNKAINIDKEYLHAIKNRALVYYLLNNLEQAFVDSQTYIKWFPEDKEMNFIKAIHFFSIKKYEETLLYINKCKGKLKTKQVYFLSGAANYFLANDAESIKDLSIALTINPTPQEAAEMYNLIGVCKNNQKPKSGCADILRAINQGSIDAKQNFAADGCN